MLQRFVGSDFVGCCTWTGGIAWITGRARRIWCRLIGRWRSAWLISQGIYQATSIAKSIPLPAPTSQCTTLPSTHMQPLNQIPLLDLWSSLALQRAFKLLLLGIDGCRLSAWMWLGTECSQIYSHALAALSKPNQNKMPHSYYHPNLPDTTTSCSPSLQYNHQSTDPQYSNSYKAQSPH